jgi:3-oxoacyl-[acyl-carrier-protein] synthase-3
MRVKVVATGFDSPERVETAADIAPRLGRSESWIVARTGVRRRHVADPDEDLACFGARVARQALGAGPAPDLILNASALPRQALPDNSAFLQRALGLSGIASHTVHASCLSFLVALHTAAVHVGCGAYRRVLIVSVDFGTRGRNWDEPESAALLGDGGAAAVVEATPEGEASALLAWRMSMWPEGADLTEVRGAGLRCHPNDPSTRPEDNLFHMKGPAVYRIALEHLPGLLLGTIADAGLRVQDVDLVVPHQASGPGLALLPRLGFAPERTVNVVAEYGNCVAASLPMALAIAERDGRLRRGQHVFLCGTGAGLGAAAAVLRW